MVIITKLKTKNKLTLKRVQYLCILIFALNFLTPLQDILATEVYPSIPQFLRITITATLQVVTLLLALVQKDKTENDETT